jgi:hypothetical protein
MSQSYLVSRRYSLGLTSGNASYANHASVDMQTADMRAAIFLIISAFFACQDDCLALKDALQSGY